MTKVEIDAQYGHIYIELKDGNLTFEFDGGDGISTLSDEEAREVYDILHKRFAE